MLKGIDPLLTPDLLKMLAEMGHGDEIIIADANFTGRSLSRQLVGGYHGNNVFYIPGATVEQMAAAVLTLLPLDEAVEQPVAYMQVSGTPAGYRSAQQRAVIAMMQNHGYARSEQCQALERFAFYERVSQAMAIVITGERQPFGNFLLKKGVLIDALVV